MLEQGACLSDLARWASMIREFPYYRELEINGRTCIIVHAGYTEELPEEVRKYWAPEDFYLYARDEAYLMGGKEHGMIVFGHTPTIVEGMFPYNKGEIFRYHDEEKDCVFYDIDCGCVFRGNNAMARLACLRLEDEAVFYL